MTPEAIVKFNNYGYEVETKEDSPRIAVIIDNQINYKRRHNLETRETAIIWIEMGNGKNRMIIGNYYREWKRHRFLRPWTDHPDDQLWRFEQFVKDWERVLKTSDCEVHVLGDVNLDRQRWAQLGFEPNPKVAKLVDMLYDRILSLGVVQTVNETTRIGAGRGQIVHSTLDLHFTNNPEKIKKVISEMLTSSDHCYIEFQRSGVKDYVVPNYTRRRQWKKIN